jgi:hypothetical protein
MNSSDGQKKRKQVTRACMRCKQSHACCDSQRPCSRCVSLGFSDSCLDSEQKKRGRKRKEEEEPQEQKYKKQNDTQTDAMGSSSVWQTPFTVSENYPIFNESSIGDIIKVSFLKKLNNSLRMKVPRLN